MPGVEDVRVTRRASPRGVSLLLVSTVVYGAVPALLVSRRGDLDLLTLLGLRGVVAAIAMGALWSMSAARNQAVRSKAPRPDRRPFLLGLLAYGPTMALYYTSFDYLDTSVAVAVAFIYPTVVVLLGSATQRRRPPALDLGLGVLALLGVAALSLPGADGSSTTVGVIMVIVSSVAYAGYVLLASTLSSQNPPLLLATQVTAGGALSTLAIALFAGGFELPAYPGSWMVVIAQGLFLVVGTVTYFGGLAALGATRASLIDSAQPLVAAVAGTILLNERLVPVQLLGIGIIVASVGGAVWSMRAPGERKRTLPGRRWWGQP